MGWTCYGSRRREVGENHPRLVARFALRPLGRLGVVRVGDGLRRSVSIFYIVETDVVHSSAYPMGGCSPWLSSGQDAHWFSASYSFWGLSYMWHSDTWYLMPEYSRAIRFWMASFRESPWRVKRSVHSRQSGSPQSSRHGVWTTMALLESGWSEGSRYMGSGWMMANEARPPNPARESVQTSCECCLRCDIVHPLWL